MKNYDYVSAYPKMKNYDYVSAYPKLYTNSMYGKRLLHRNSFMYIWLIGFLVGVIVGALCTSLFLLLH